MCRLCGLLLRFILLLLSLNGLVVGFEMVGDCTLNFVGINLTLLHLILLLLGVVSALRVSTKVIVTLASTTFWCLYLVLSALFAVLSLVVFAASIASVAASITIISVFAAASVIIVVVVIF